MPAVAIGLSVGEAGGPWLNNFSILMKYVGTTAVCATTMTLSPFGVAVVDVLNAVQPTVTSGESVMHLKEVETAALGKFKLPLAPVPDIELKAFTSAFTVVCVAPEIVIA